MYLITPNFEKATLKKRKYGLLKKVSEISVLCGIETCLILKEKDDSIIFFSSHGNFEILESLKSAKRTAKLTNQEVNLIQINFFLLVSIREYYLF